MRSFSTWFLVLLVASVVAPYVLGVRPRTRRDWLALALIIAFLMWLLPRVVRSPSNFVSRWLKLAVAGSRRHTFGHSRLSLDLLCASRRHRLS